MENADKISYHSYTHNDSMRCLTAKCTETDFNDLHETEVDENDIKVDIKSETSSECYQSEENITDTSAINVSANRKSEGTTAPRVVTCAALDGTLTRNTRQCNGGTQSERKPSFIKKKRMPAYCPFSVALKCPLCPKFIKGGLQNMPHLENHIISNHYQYRSRIPCLVQKYMDMRKPCKCLFSSHGCEEYFNHL